MLVSTSALAAVCASPACCRAKRTASSASFSLSEGRRDIRGRERVDIFVGCGVCVVMCVLKAGERQMRQGTYPYICVVWTCMCVCVSVCVAGCVLMGGGGGI